MIVYILQNQTGQTYVGITYGLSRRLREHRSGKTKSLKGMDRDWEVLWYYETETYSQASKLEKFLHRFKTWDYVDLISRCQTFDQIKKHIEGKKSDITEMRMDFLESKGVKTNCANARRFCQELGYDPAASL